MAKNVALGIRLEPAERDALDRLAAEQRRPVSSLARAAIADWLEERGFLASEPKREEEPIAAE